MGQGLATDCRIFTFEFCKSFDLYSYEYAVIKKKETVLNGFSSPRIFEMHLFFCFGFVVAVFVLFLTYNLQLTQVS